jgi:hypothetical protein
MKNSFLLTYALSGTAYAVAVVAELCGVLPFSVLSCRAFVGCYVAAGVLGLFVSDYARTATPGQRHAPRSNAATQVAASRSPVAVWTHQTRSV